MNINNWSWENLVTLAKKLGLTSQVAVAKSIKRKYPKKADKLAKARVILKRNIRIKLGEAKNASNYN